MKIHEDKNTKTDPTQVKGWKSFSPEQKVIANSEMDAKRADELLRKTAQEISARFGESSMNAFSSELFS